MTVVVLARLLGVIAIVAVGYVAARRRTLGSDDAATVLSNLAFLILTPALLFRTTALVDLATLPWVTLAAFFGPALVVLLAWYLAGRVLRRDGDPAGAPAVRAISVTSRCRSGSLWCSPSTGRRVCACTSRSSACMP